MERLWSIKVYATVSCISQHRVICLSLQLHSLKKCVPLKSGQTNRMFWPLEYQHYWAIPPALEGQCVCVSMCVSVCVCVDLLMVYKPRQGSSSPSSEMPWILTFSIIIREWVNRLIAVSSGTKEQATLLAVKHNQTPDSVKSVTCSELSTGRSFIFIVEVLTCTDFFFF